MRLVKPEIQKWREADKREVPEGIQDVSFTVVSYGRMSCTFGLS